MSKHLGYSTGTIVLVLKQSYPEELWEKIEDAIANALTGLRIRGNLSSGVTGNTVQFGQISSKQKVRTFESVRTTGGYEVKTKIGKEWYTIADCYSVLSVGDAQENAKLIAHLLNKNNHNQAEVKK
jgi:hypothetical protein